MSVTDKVKNRESVLPPGTTLPEGGEVNIEIPNDDSLLSTIQKPAKPVHTFPSIMR
jgi:hypothetical protein